MATEYTYNGALRPTLAQTWRPLMAAALSELERDPGLVDEDHWSGIALGGLLPGPDLRLDDHHPDATLKHAQKSWVTPDAFADLISRWLPIAQGEPAAADGLVRFARCGPLPWQATT